MQPRKKIAVNTRFLIKGKIEGVGYFTQEILKELVQQHPEVDFVFLFDRDFDEEYIFAKNVTGVVLPPQARHPFLWYIWFEISVALWLKKNKVDLFLSPDNFTSLNAKLQKVTVIHDLAFEHFPNQVNKIAQWFYRHFIPKYVQSSDKIIAVSDYTKSDIISLYKTEVAKIDVVHNAANEFYKPISEQEKTAVKSQFASGCDFFVYVGSLNPRKNISNLLLAFDLFKSQSQNNVKLILVGRKYGQNEELEVVSSKMQFKNEVIFTGHLDSETTAKIVASAIALCYVSLFEGFGIPIIEAQQAGTAVITSNVSSMPEVAGDAALLVNPENVEDVSIALNRIYSDSSFRQSLIQKGFENAKRFSWAKSADKLWESISPFLR